MLNQQLGIGIVSIQADLTQFTSGLAKVQASLASIGSGSSGGRVASNLAAAGAKAAADLDAIQDRYVKRDYDRRVAYEARLEKAKEAARARDAAAAAREAAKLEAIQDRMIKRDYDRRVANEAKIANAAEKSKLTLAARAVTANARENKRVMDEREAADTDRRAVAIRTVSSAGMGFLQGAGLGGFAMNPAQLAGQAVGGGISMMADGLKDAVTHSMDLEQTFVGLRRVSGESAGNVDKFRKTIFDISKTQAGVSVQDLTTMAMAGAKAGITDKEGLAGLETFTRGLAKVRNSVQGIGTEQLADDMTRILNLFHKGTDYVESFGSVLARMDNVSTSSASDILDISKSLSGTFNSLGMTIPQVMAFSSVLSDVGLTNQQGAGSFSQILRMMASDSADMAEKMGVPVEVFQQKIRTDAMGALGMLIAKFRELNEVDPLKAQEFISGLGFRGVKTAGALQQLSAMYEQVQERTKMAIEEETTLGSLQAANDLNSTTAIGNIQKLKNAFEELSDAIGSKVVPHLTEASKAALEMLNRMTGGKEGAPQDITATERTYRNFINGIPEALRFPSDRAAVAEIDRKEKAYNDRLNTAPPTLDEQVANLQRAKAGASPAMAAKMDDAIAQLKMDQANATANSPEGMKAAAKALLGDVTKVPGLGDALGKPAFGGLPGMAYDQGLDFTDPEAKRADLERGDVFARPSALETSKAAAREKALADSAEYVNDKGMRKFSSQSFGDPADFARNAITTALSDKDDVPKKALAVHEQSKTILSDIREKLLAGNPLSPNPNNQMMILRGPA